MVLRAGIPVLGPPPAELFDPVPHADLVRAIVGDLDALLADLGGDTRNVILIFSPASGARPPAGTSGRRTRRRISA